MICAVELLMMNGVTLEEKRREQMEKERQRAEAVEKNTIAWCENELQEAMIKSALSGKETISADFDVRFNDSGEEFTIINSTFSRKGRMYYYDCGGWKNWKLFKNHLEQHCISVTVQYEQFPCLNGRNFTYGMRMHIFVDKANCLKG